MNVATRCGLMSMVVVILVGCGTPAERSGGDTVAEKPAPASPSAVSGVQGTEAKMPAGTQGEVRFIAEEQPSIILTLREDADGGLTGTLAEGGDVMPLAARRTGVGFAGTVGPAGGALRFTATEQGDRVMLEIGGADEAQRLTFRRATGGDQAAAPGAPAADGRRHVVINERRLTDDELARVEQAYRIRIPDADYWYDPTLGAWGAKG